MADIARPEAQFEEHVLQRLQRKIRRLPRCKHELTQHINGVRHKANIQRNTFTHYILEQVETFKEKDPIHSASSTAETSNFIVISSDEQPKEKNNLMGKPRKKVKKCEDYRPSK